jgi:alpha-L-arabinofuranosidase
LAMSCTAADEIVIHADKPGVAVSPTLYGAFFEDINRAGDGGLYAEMIQNRSFEDYPGLPLGWTLLRWGKGTATMALDTSHPLNANNPTSLRVDVTSADKDNPAGVFNRGWKGIIAPDKQPDTSPEWLAKYDAAQTGTTDGMVIHVDQTYDMSLYARAEHLTGTVTVALTTEQGQALVSGTIGEIDKDWSRFTLKLTPGAFAETAMAAGGNPLNNCRLLITADQPGTLWLDMVSLLPAEQNEYEKIPSEYERTAVANHWRPDLFQMMEDMKPGLLRFPGGSFSEAHLLKDAWRWKTTIGPIEERAGHWDIWGYRSNDGLGFYEYLKLAEALHADPLYVAHVGMAEIGFVPMDELGPWIQDTLDAIEYANGPVTSKWGALRAKAGHPAPFNLKYVEIGNENGEGFSWGGGTRSDYLPRYKAFYEAIKKAHPEITTLANIDTGPDAPAEMIDEHHYESADWFFKAATLYDHYDRSKPKLYVGEYADTKDSGLGNMRAALAEAAFMTGMERNSDVVRMSSYAPLFSNRQWQRWKPDAIVFNSTQVYGTPSYYVQKMFGQNRPDVVLPVTLPKESGTDGPMLFATAGKLKHSFGEVILKVVNRGSESAKLDVRIEGGQELMFLHCTELSAKALTDENTFGNMTEVMPSTSGSTVQEGKITHVFPPYSVTVLRFTQVIVD